MSVLSPASDHADLPFVPRLLHRVALARGARVFVDAAYKHFGYVELADGRRVRFKGTAFDLNGQAAGLIAKDKHHTATLLNDFGLRTPVSVLVHAPRARHIAFEKRQPFAETLTFAEPALAFIAEHGLPVFIKPNDGTGGANITQVASVDAAFDSLARIFERSDQALVQRPISGRDFRVVVVDSEVTAAYERIPATVTGDGSSTIAELISRAGLDATDVASPALDLAHRPAPGANVRLSEIASLSRGGRSIDLTGRLGPDLSSLAVAAADAIGLRFGGLDIIAPSPTSNRHDITVLEVNSAPSLEKFATAHPDHMERAIATYDRILAGAGKAT